VLTGSYGVALGAVAARIDAPQPTALSPDTAVGELNNAELPAKGFMVARG
jgi:hypothetical protein